MGVPPAGRVPRPAILAKRGHPDISLHKFDIVCVSLYAALRICAVLPSGIRRECPQKVRETMRLT